VTVPQLHAPDSDPPGALLAGAKSKPSIAPSGREVIWKSLRTTCKAGWSWGCVATVDSNGQKIFVADAHRDNGKRFVVTADEKLTARNWNR
jgi:hypothetical protein